MLTEIGASVGGGDMSPETRARAEAIIKDFEAALGSIVQAQSLRKRFIRPLLQGSIICGALGKTYYVAYNPHLGLPSVIFTTLSGQGKPDLLSFYNFVRDEIGVDVSVVALEDEWIDSPQKKEILNAVALDLINRELAIASKDSNIMTNIPIFGPNHYPIVNELVFVLMPFEQELTSIYNEFIKTTVEDKGLVCRRADDITSNNAIIQDIWKSICEARFIIADISTLNPNVMYELGVAHAIGKETILIHQEGSSNKLPFDIPHIRILNYRNTATGGKELKEKIGQAIDSVISKLNAASMKAS